MFKACFVVSLLTEIDMGEVYAEITLVNIGDQTAAEKVEETSETTLAGGVKVPSRITEFVEIRWKNRKAACEAVVLPGEDEILLGAYPLEGMDLMVHPQRQEVTGAHGDKIRNVVK
jgi:hypothetical protein